MHFCMRWQYNPDCLIAYYCNIMTIFGPKQWVNPFGKKSIFRLFELLVFIAQKGIFRSRILYKTFSWSILPKKKKFEKQPFLVQNHGLTPLEKCQFFDFFNCLFLQPREAFFVLEYPKRHFPGQCCLKKKVGKMAIFGPKPWVNPLGKM